MLKKLRNLKIICILQNSTYFFEKIMKHLKVYKESKDICNINRNSGYLDSGSVRKYRKTENKSI